MIQYSPEKIFINKNVQNSKTVKKILNKHINIPIEIIENQKQIKFLYEKSKDPIKQGKKYLYLTENKGRFLKKCPGTNGFVCCNYYVIDLIENCHFECSYCFLQKYLNDKIIKVYVNLENLFKELDELISNEKKLYRIGTGELSDSLALDNITGFSQFLIPYFAKKENALLELKTKSNQINDLLDLESNGRTIISWSVNPEIMIKKNEHKTASLNERLKSAKKCMLAGYQLALHFDPLIYYTDWEKDYQNLINQIFEKIDSERIAWISLGTFRYSNDLKIIMENRFMDNSILYEEFLQSPDGKYRYFVKTREMLYKKIKKMLLSKDKNLMIYLCMEAKHMWKRVYKINSGERINLDLAFKTRQKQMAKIL